MIEDSTLELFDNYLDGNLSKTETVEFERRLNQNEELSEQFDLYRQGIELIKLEGLKGEVKDLLDRRKVVPFYKKSVWRYSVAASIALVSFWAYFLNKPTAAPEDLFSDFYQPYPNIYQIRGSSDSLTNAMNSYSQQDYEQAIALLDEINDKNDGVHFYQALSFLSLRKPVQSLELFNKLSQETIFNEQTRWYKALAFLIINQQDSTIKYLKKITPDQFNYQKAEELLEELN